MAKLRLVVADDTSLIRHGIRSLLASSETVELVGEAGSAGEAVELAERLLPGIILLDQDMPGLDSVEAIKLIKERLPKAEIIVLAERIIDEKAFRALEAGASGYVLKDIDPEHLMRAIEGVCRGETLMHPCVARQLVDRFRMLAQEKHGKNGKNGQDGTYVCGVTSRELEILLELTTGATDREIAEKMYLSSTTVKSHIRAILRKIGAKNRTQAVVYVLRNGLIH